MIQPRESHDLPVPLEAAIRNGANHDVPPEILNRARLRLDELRERMETREMERNRKHGFLSLSTSWGRWLAFATPVAALLVAGLIFLNSADGGAAAYASAVRRLRTAENMVVTLLSRVEGMPEQKMELTYNNHGSMRYDAGNGIYSVLDMSQKKVLVIDSGNKQATETNLANLPANKMKAQTDLIEQIRRMPEKANKSLGQKLLNGNLVNGFQVIENNVVYEIWIDASTPDLVQIDGRFEKMAGMSFTMTNFRYNVPLAADFFSTAIPAGFKKETMQMDMRMDQASAEDIASLLEMWSAFSPDNSFPDSLNPAELVKSVQAFEKAHQADKDKLTHPYFQKLKKMKKENLKEETIKNSQRTARAMVFIMQAKPENDWHYAGKGVKFGDAKTPIAWWKPTGQKDYKVIFGDLSIKDVPAEDIPTAPGFKKDSPPSATPSH